MVVARPHHYDFTMLVFVDESGDPGLKIGSGSSKFFTVTTVVFPNGDAAKACEEKIKQFRHENGLAQHKEFHFSKDSPKIRTGFLRAVTDHDFWYSAAILNKSELSDPQFRAKESVYTYTVDRAFSLIMSELNGASVVFDACGGRVFGQQLRRYVQQKANDHSPDGGRLKRVKSAKSHCDNLLQLADMVCGAVARSYSEKADAKAYRKILRDRERRVEAWPEIDASA